ncbi:hypothetical protein VPH35_133846 [Triticum aestivum]|uniref:Putative disease resistance protein RGA3 n=1 Tax=Aegilops tauschii TaxID=37682 RepID=N1R5U6_AEGTA|nr:putative disease resistance protein RGA3 [Triticum aestivum]XP_044445730.1 putative disease resistance protein RGA3 [Triticum aestivum]
MTDLKTAAYHADDVLDDFRYEALRLRAAQMRPYSTARKMLSYFTTSSPIVFRLSMSRKMKDALEMIDELVVEMNNFHFLQHAGAPTIVQPQTHSHVNELQIVGRQDEKEQVVKILLNQSDNSNIGNSGIMVLPIVGMGGIGKTTLAQLVHNDQRVKDHFELVLWVCVSDKFIIEEIIRSIIEVATMKKCGLTQMEALQKELSKVLAKKRSGSAVIVTSRNDQVASMMGTLPPHQMSLLNEDQSWELFHKNAFGREVEKPEEFNSIAKSILHKCKGLPLAINTVATLLHSKHHSQWVSILNSDVWKNDVLATGIVPALQLSYDHLSSEAKLCFSFCAIFPKDSPMDTNMLIQLWMANDFTASETIGQQIFNMLVQRCFLQDVEIQKNRLSQFRHGFIHRPTTCKMHDLMHDLADSVSGNGCFHLQSFSSRRRILEGSIDAGSLQHQVRHLSLDYDYFNVKVMMKILAPGARTILSQRQLGYQRPLRKSKSELMSLRAVKTFPSITQMTNLKHLRYLDCSYSDISALPEATTMLYCLQTLKLIGCRELKKLPEGMRYMSSLRHIFLVGCHSLEQMPQGISQLNSRQTLTSYVIDSDTGRGIDQLKDLNLCGALSLTELRKVHGAENAKQGNMSDKHNLKRLSLDWTNGHYGSYFGYGVDNIAEGILEALRPHKKLEVLLLSNYTGPKFSSWMHNCTQLEHLSELSLTGCENCKYLPPLWQLPSLGYLALDGLHSVTSICIVNDEMDNVESCISRPPFFPKLETMIISDMPELERWHQEVAGQVAIVSLPQLKKLIIDNCPMLSSMPRTLPLVEDLQVVSARDIPLHHLMNLSMQSNLECKGSIVVEPVGCLSMDLHFSRLGDSDVLVRLTVLRENVGRFEEEMNRTPCRFIKKLDIIDCDCLFSHELSQIQRNIWNHFGFVESMWITGINNIIQWPAVEFRNLNHLRLLHLSCCSNLTGSFPSTISDDENVLLPRLQVLKIIGCENLVEIPRLPASLEILHISCCQKLVSMPIILGNIKKMRELEVYRCSALATFLDGMHGITALKKLRMECCPTLETLPEGLLQQLPALQELCITDCPKLEEAFSGGGTYWDLVEANLERSSSEGGICWNLVGETATGGRPIHCKALKKIARYSVANSTL